jgi:hypothetical protein
MPRRGREVDPRSILSLQSHTEGFGHQEEGHHSKGLISMLKRHLNGNATTLVRLLPD